MTFESSKNLSVVGALLIILGAILGTVVSFTGVLSLIGIILLLIGLKGLANYYKEEGIFSNALYSVIISIVAFVVAIGIIVISALSALADIIDIDWENIEEWANVGTEVGDIFTNLDFNAITTLLGALFVGLIIFYAVLIISMFFLRKSMNQLSTKSGISLFGTAGILMLIGAVIPIAGLLLIGIGFIIATIAFFQLKKE